MFLIDRSGCIMMTIVGTALLFTPSAKSDVLEVPARYPTIQAAIDSAANGDTVLVAPGTYFENIDYRDKQITVGSQFLMTGDTSFVSRTVLNGNQNGSVVTVSFNHQDGAMAVLSGLTVTNGKAPRGGGIYSIDSNAKLDHLVITKNTVDDINPTIFQGGGILFESINYPSKLILTHSVISGNTASKSGGGICLSEWADAELFDVLISNNMATESGGGLSIYGQGVIGSTTVAFDHVEIKGNHANDGGGIYCLGAAVNTDLRGLIVHGNTASKAGGGLYLAFSNLENATVFGNTAPKGSGVHCGSTAIIKNSILWNSGASEISFNAYSVQDTFSISYTDIRGGNNAVVTDNVGILKWLQGNFNLDPRFTDPADGDFHLAADSPCIDAGDPASDYSNEPHYNGKRIDVGAYGNTSEATPSSPRIDITRQDIDFAEVYFGQTKTEQFTIRNLGKSRLNVALDLLSDAFSLLSDSSYSILGGDSSMVQVQFSPVRTGPDSATLYVSSNDPLDDNSAIVMRGWGVLGGTCKGRLMKKYSPFLVNEDLLIAEGDSLIIEPGVTVLTNLAVLIRIKGSLIAEGTDADSITFTSAQPVPFPGSWKGLRFEFPRPNTQSRVDRCQVLYAVTGITADGYALTVKNSRLAFCKVWGVWMSAGILVNVEQNIFHDLYEAVDVAMAVATMRKNRIVNATKGVSLFGKALIEDNTFENVGCGVQVWECYQTVIRSNRFVGTGSTVNGVLQGALLRYLENHPIEALNATYGAIVTGGGLADAYLLNLNEFGDPNRDCVLLSTSSFDETVSIPKEGYTRSVRLDNSRPIVLRTRDGGYAKLTVITTYTIGSTNYGARTFRYVYVPAGIDSFPRVSSQDYSDGIVVERGALKVSGNEITNFAGRGIAFQNADVDSFVNNRIFGNSHVGVLFHGPSYFRNEEIVFRAGNDPSQFNDIFNNGEFDFVNGTQTSLRLPYSYWGTTDSTQIATRILDGNDFPELGVVNFSPFLDEAHNPISEVDEKEPAIARNFRLRGIHPNPFREQISASFEIGRIVQVTVRVYNLLGQEIKTIAQQKFIPDVYEVNWDGRDRRGSQVAAGVYLFEFSVEKQRITKRILRIK